MHNIIDEARSHIGNMLWVRALKKHKTKMGRILAPAYTDYLIKAQNSYSEHPNLPSELHGCADEFLEKGFTSFRTEETGKLAQEIMRIIAAEEEKKGDALWNDMARYTGGEIFSKFPQIESIFAKTIGPVMNAIFKAHYKIFYGLMYKSVRTIDERAYSQIWHSDGGPGTCINVMLTLVDTDPENGAFESLPWHESVDIFSRERAALRAVGTLPHDHRSDNRREDLNYFRNNYYEKEVTEKYSNRTTQFTGQAGTIIAFRNNILHRGGFVKPGRTRHAIVFHVYPSVKEVPLEEYRTKGIAKVTGIPSSPDFDDENISLHKTDSKQ